MLDDLYGRTPDQLKKMKVCNDKDLAEKLLEELTKEDDARAAEEEKKREAERPMTPEELRRFRWLALFGFVLLIVVMYYLIDNFGGALDRISQGDKQYNYDYHK